MAVNSISSQLVTQLAVATVAQGTAPGTELFARLKEYVQVDLRDTLKVLADYVSLVIFTRQPLRIELPEQVKIHGVSSVVEMNQIVSDATNGKIPSYFTQTPAEELIVLAIANFSKLWLYQFETVKPGSFHTPGGSVPCEMMANEMDLFGTERRIADQFLTIADLPYKGGEATMRVILPNPMSKEGWSLTPPTLSDADLQFIAGLQLEEKWTDTNVQMPKFVQQNVHNLTSQISKLFPELFAPGSLDGLFPGAYVTSVQQNASIAVTEKGTDAVACTGIRCVSICASATLICNRPFVYMILVKGFILFVGVVVKPTLD
jgi:serine protease inhibitor